MTTAGAPSEISGSDQQEHEAILVSDGPAAQSSNGNAEPASQARYSKSAMARMPKVQCNLIVHFAFSAVLLHVCHAQVQT